MSENGGAMNRRAVHLELIAPAPSLEEAAAIAGALERFVRETARPPAGGSREPEAWARAALLEGVGRAEQPDPVDPWINT